MRMDPSSYPPIPPDVARIAGPLMIGYLFNWGLFGVLCMQVFLYYLCVSKDPFPVQAIVYTLCAFQAAQTFLLTQSAFNTFASGFGNINLIHDMHHLWFSIPIMTSTITLFVQIFYAYRIFTMSRRSMIPAVITVLAAIQFGGGLATGVFAQRASSFSRFMGRTENVTAGIWHGAGALGDIFICSSMLYHLTRSNSPHKISPTPSPWFLRLLIQSGGIVTSIAILNTILFLLPGDPPPTYFQTTVSILGNTYFITFMALLNSRMRLARASSIEFDSEREIESTGRTRPGRIVFAPWRSEGTGRTTGTGTTLTTSVGDLELEATSLDDIERRTQRRTRNEDENKDKQYDENVQEQAR